MNNQPNVNSFLSQPLNTQNKATPTKESELIAKGIQLCRRFSSEFESLKKKRQHLILNVSKKDFYDHLYNELSQTESDIHSKYLSLFVYSYFKTIIDKSSPLEPEHELSFIIFLSGYFGSLIDQYYSTKTKERILHINNKYSLFIYKNGLLLESANSQYQYNINLKKQTLRLNQNKLTKQQFIDIYSIFMDIFNVISSTDHTNAYI